MTETLVAIWNSCNPDHEATITDTDPWDNMSAAEKYAELKVAIETAANEFTVRFQGSTATPRWIFVGTEYALGNKQVPASEMLDTLTKIRGLSGENSNPLIVPGTGMMENPDTTKSSVYNYTVAFHAGQKVAEVAKKGNVSEPVTEGSTFKKGNGKATFDISGNTFGVQICQDATGTVPFPSDVDVQIVTGRGVGIRASTGGLAGLGISEQASKYIIVGDTYKPDIKFCGQARTINDIQVNPYGGANLGNSSIGYYKIDI